MNLVEPLIQGFCISITLMLTIRLEQLVMIVFLLMLHYFMSKINIMIVVSWQVLQMLGMNGINISFGVMKVKMKIKYYMMLLMESVIRSSNGLVIGYSLGSGVLQLIQKHLSMIETNSFNWEQE